MRRNARHTAFGLALTTVLAIISGCSALGGGGPQAASGPSDLESPTIRVATVPTSDLAAFWIAQQDGYFKAEGLTVEELSSATTQVALTKTISGEAAIGLATYPAMVLAKLRDAGDLQLVADGTSASPKSNELLTVPNSPVKTVKDLAGKRIAISALNQASHILTQSVMLDHGVDTSKVTWVPMPLPNVAAALERGDVEAGYQPEPFLTQAAKTVGAIPVIDVASASTLDFPITGYAAMGKWVKANPKTLAAFQRAMLRATRDATNDRKKVQDVVVVHAKVDPDIAALMTLPNFRSKLDSGRIQRVPDLLQKLNIISIRFDVAPMIAAQLP